MVTFETELSVSSINNTMKGIDNYIKKLEDAKIHIHNELANRAYELLVTNTPVDTGELIDSFITDISKEMARVYTTCPHAKYVEFGTGVRGQSTGYPIETASIIVEDGWKGYSSEISGQYGQKFFYDTWLTIKKEGPNIIERVLKERGLL